MEQLLACHATVPPRALSHSAANLRRAIDEYRSRDQHDMNDSKFLLNYRFTFTDKDEDALQPPFSYGVCRGLLPPAESLAQLLLSASPRRLEWLRRHSSAFAIHSAPLLSACVAHQRADLVRLLLEGAAPLEGLLALALARGAFECASAIIAARGAGGIPLEEVGSFLTCPSLSQGRFSGLGVLCCTS